MYSLTQLGFEALRPTLTQNYDAARLGRVVTELGGSYIVVGPSADRKTVSIVPALLDDRPAVGDFVELDPTLEVIERIVPRRTQLVRKAAGVKTKRQLIAANIDVVFIVTSMNDEFNLSRLERYLAVAWESGARPVVVLNKADLPDYPEDFVLDAESVAFGVPIVEMTAVSDGAAALEEHLEPGSTCVLVGSSGVGKSTIVNGLLGTPAQDVGEIRENDDEGRHTTTRRELLMLPDDRGILIDTPGMRELALWNAHDGLSQTFEDIERLAVACRFRDCAHNGEPGCAIEEALIEGDLELRRLESYEKLQRELAYHERKRSAAATRAESRRWAKKVRNATKEVW